MSSDYFKADLAALEAIVSTVSSSGSDCGASPPLSTTPLSSKLETNS